MLLGLALMKDPVILTTALLTPPPSMVVGASLIEIRRSPPCLSPVDISTTAPPLSPQGIDAAEGESDAAYEPV